jgi:hypothetical protein
MKVEAEMSVPVLVTTDKRGVFFGYYEGDPSEAGTKVTLSNARMIVYWSAETRGVLGLAAHGPKAGSRVTAAVPQLILEGITAIGVCTDAAVKVMETGPWA